MLTEQRLTKNLDIFLSNDLATKENIVPLAKWQQMLPAGTSVLADMQQKYAHAAAYMSLAFNSFKQGTLLVPYTPALEQNGLFTQDSLSQSRFITPSLQAYLAAQHINQKKIDILLLSRVRFDMLVTTCYFLVNIWVEAGDRAALGAFFQKLLLQLKQPCKNRDYDYKLLLHLTWEEANRALAAQDASDDKKKDKKPYFSSDLQQKITLTYSKTNSTPSLFSWQLYNIKSPDKTFLHAASKFNLHAKDSVERKASQPTQPLPLSESYWDRVFFRCWEASPSRRREERREEDEIKRLERSLSRPIGMPKRKR